LIALNKNIEKILDVYNPISIDVLESMKLLRRYDTKFIIAVESVPGILDYLQKYFDILEINGQRQFRYENQYYDTRDYKFFNQHHNGKLNRYKIRERNYIDSDKSFLEVKLKTSDFFTDKKRISTAPRKNEFDDISIDFIKRETGEDPCTLLPKLKVDYTRITLVNIKSNEKVTIDRHIFFKNTLKTYDMEDAAIIEVKQMPRNNASPVIKYLNSICINNNVGFSKYCMGLVLTDMNVKHNKFKKTLQSITKISRRNDGR